MLDPLSIGTAKRFGLRQLPSPTQALARVAALLVTWEARARERRMLAEMPDRMLKDLGITRIDADREAAKPLWRG
jgi:uncharacterized protein YjiS (DUF1127 family)